ncbi:selenocysteine-specific elongation factor [Caloramator quimbayensis]|uniref:Selenocysteine-specific elongation factor n=1 Tax=Caloramator quimbayensis TaxID=1147123 RepID=A0A1T4XYU8_9CLOT|nr:selenocysteine-specific translation elongation factor [Caloramator quimbayensis]SKA94732.1 selenocysteine-specific elongation factor [Caloramator quimbayensis]
MQHIVIGTAGHIDHGKTTLIKALTGRDTDTLREEKERGISINLGFTYFDLPSGKRAGIVDVPGHERFIKNMLAGVGGIDVVLLVIAADEGVMPQTVEHVNILELLDIKKGIVVITKKDMVDDEWLKMIADDIKKYLGSTFLKEAPIIPVSSINGDGLDILTKTIDEMTQEIEDRDVVTDFRLPIDRVFTISGFGTVVTGTLISGTIKEGDLCEIYTKGIKTKIRSIQVHEESVKEAGAGQRVAVNLSGVKTDEVQRGDVLSKVGAMESSLIIDCRLKYLKDAEKPLKNRDRIRLYHGTSEILGRVIILDKEIVNPGDTALIQIRLEGSIAARRGDKYVIRSYSPMHTIGGGTILEPNAAKHKINDKKVIEELLLKEKGNPSEVVEKTIEKFSNVFPKKEDIIKLSGKGVLNAEDIISDLINKGKIFEIKSGDGNVYIHIKYIEHQKENASKLLKDYHGLNPLKAGMPKEEFKVKLFGKNIKQRLYDELLLLLKEDTIDLSENYIWLKGFEIKFDDKQEKIKEEIIKKFEEAHFQPPKAEDMLKGFGKEEKSAKMVFASLVDMDKIIKINEEMYLTKENYEEAKNLIRNIIENNGFITLGEFRDKIGSSRKYAVALLEHFDTVKFTKRLEDKRVLY